MNRLLAASILTTGLALSGAAGVYAAEQYGSSPDAAQQSENYQQYMIPDNSGLENREYTVKAGDTLASIAEELLGSPDRWTEIARANNIQNPDRITEGETLSIPAAENETSGAGHEGTAQRENAASETATDDSAESGQSRDNQPMSHEQELKGEITAIRAEKDILSLKDERGITHSLTRFEEEGMLEGLAVGDFVKVEIENGTVVSLEKIDMSA